MAIRYAPGIYSVRNANPSGKTEAIITIDNKQVSFYSQTVSVVKVNNFLSSQVNPTDLVIEYQGANYDNIVTTSTI
jgi:hypothetical protein